MGYLRYFNNDFAAWRRYRGEREKVNINAWKCGIQSDKELTQWSMQCTKSKSSCSQVSEVFVLPDTLSLHVSKVSRNAAHFLVSPHFSLRTSCGSSGSSSSPPSSCTYNRPEQTLIKAHQNISHYRGLKLIRSNYALN